MKFRLAIIAAAITVAFPPLAHGQDTDLLGAPLTSLEKSYNRVQKQVKADLAHARGYTGFGAVVAVLDTGVMGTHLELKTQLASTQMFDSSIGRYVTPTDLNGHGTHVAGIVAGSTGTGYSYGIAPDAKILPIKVFSSSTWLASSTALASGLRLAAGNSSVSVINMSLGGSTKLGLTFEDALRATIAADKLVVVAAGNSGGAAPQWPARYAKETWAKGQIIAVGAVDANNRIASFSNRAGDTANWFMVAPGTSVLSSYKTGGYVYMSGTSMAAPVVAGAAAVIEGAWPQLKAGQVASILFQTATDLGAAGVDTIYGWGLLNVDRAMQPIGTLSVPLSGTTTVSGTTASVSTSVASWSGLRAAGNNGQFRGITVDDFNRDFKTDFSAGIRAPARERIADTLASAGRSLQVTEQLLSDGSRFLTAVEDQRPAGLFATAGTHRTLLASSAVFKLAGDRELALATGGLAGSYFGLADSDPSLANPYFGLTQSAAQMAFGFSRGGLKIKAGVLNGALNAAMARQHAYADVSGGRAAIGELNYALGRDAMVGLQLAEVAEGDSYLGAVTGQAMALDQARTRTVTAHATYRLTEDAVLAAQYSVGRTADSRGTGLLASTQGVHSDTFLIGLVGHKAFTRDDRLAVTLSSPLRIASGTMQLRMPVAITEAGDPVFESRRVSLAATSREMKLGVDYAMPLSRASSLSYIVALRHNANHVEGEREAQTGLVFRSTF
ncbi:S8 family peptidase [Aromatoleum diolicum]|uniref:S8 family serine peptidase n=1 Tax=Aromatoleum diolicum TaxID=75796 RepID=A0ABX1QA19_9RHOO|nr:S8 family peptidase [Aromatoleum diolicum]NMG75233.1 S8 family serine peptidase [Aromatoleum diolicum]